MYSRPHHLGSKCRPRLFCTQNIPVADAKPDDIKDLLGGALFQALYKWMKESGPVYLLPTGPVSSFLVGGHACQVSASFSCQIMHEFHATCRS